MKLTDGIEQWQLLQVVHKFFSSELPESTILETDRESLRDYKILFQVDVKTILQNIRHEYDLSNQAFEKCLRALDDVLGFFEDLLDDSLLDDKYDQVLKCSPHSSRKKQKQKKKREVFKNIVRFLKSKEPSSSLFSSDRSFRSLSSHPSSVREKPQSLAYPKLQVIRMRLNCAQDDVCKLGHYIQLRKEEDFIRTFAAIDRFDQEMKQLFKDTSSYNSPETRQSRPIKVRLYQTRSFTKALYHALVTQLAHCITPHNVKLHLAIHENLRSTTRHIDLDMFLSTCNEPCKWQETKCIITGGGASGVSEFPERKQVDNLCDLIKRSRALLRILAADNILWDISKLREMPSNPTNPTLSLRTLLDSGYFHKGGSFRISLKYKRILAVILAHNLLLLYGSPWVQEPWNAERIFFFPDSNPQNLPDLFRPYVSRSLVTELISSDTGRGDRRHKHPFILEFARLLLEIEYGETIVATEEDYDPETHEETPDTPFYTVDRMLRKVSDDIYQDYIKAIEACLDCDNFLPPDEIPSDDTEFRLALYEHIVAPLESELLKGFNISLDELVGPCHCEKHVHVQQAASVHQIGVSNIQSRTSTFSQRTPLLSRHQSATTLSANLSGLLQPSSQTGNGYTHNSYTVACICPMDVELAPVIAMLDEEHPTLPPARFHNNYTLGQIGGHNVVIVAMPEIGKSNAAAVVTQLRNDFECVRFCLLIGIGGGIPIKNVYDIRLGDVVVSKPTATFGGVVEFDRGKLHADGKFERTGSSNKPSAELLSRLRRLQAHHKMNGNEITKHLSEMLEKFPHMEKEGYAHQGVEHDILFQATYHHRDQDVSNCSGCDKRRIIERTPRESTLPRVHYGTIGSADSVVKDAEIREKLAKEQIICVDMEAAGLMDFFPCLIIRGISDYADTHKNKRWQPYAAATAAAFAKDLLSLY